MDNERGPYSNWSERHIAYAAGLGTFSLSDGFITERGIAHRCGSVVTDLVLPVSSRTAKTHLSNCLFYVNSKCRACIPRCPAGAITEEGHDKIKCRQYMKTDIGYLMEEYGVGVQGCGLCQTKVPCEFRNPAKKLNT
jgi:epoxyqueuosine reductase QueG